MAGFLGFPHSGNIKEEPASRMKIIREAASHSRLQIDLFCSVPSMKGGIHRGHPKPFIDLRTHTHMSRYPLGLATQPRPFSVDILCACPKKRIDDHTGVVREGEALLWLIQIPDLNGRLITGHQGCRETREGGRAPNGLSLKPRTTVPKAAS